MTRRSKKPAVPDPPKGLNPAARARWAAVAANVARHGAVDLEQLALYCQVWVRWREAEDGLSKTGQLVKSGGRVVANPLIAIANQAGSQARALEGQLGIGDTPAPAATGEPTVTRRELATLMGKHPQTVSKWEMAGMPVADRGRSGRPSRYAPTAVRAWLTEREKTNPKVDVVVDAQQERRARARKEDAQATLAEQMFQQRAGKLLPIEDVNKVWAAEIAGVRAVILASYTTHADRVYRAATLEGLGGVERALKEMSYEVLRELGNPDRPIERAS